MTKPLFFDTDCLSAFLWVNNQSLLAQLYPGRIVIPNEVYVELSNPTIPHLKNRVDSLIKNKEAIIEDIQVDTEEYRLYRKMTYSRESGYKIIGSGEAASIALAKVRGGIVASNNLRDIKEYVSEYNLQYKTTGDIMKEALEKGLITETEGNKLWQDMLKKRRKLGYTTFSEFLHNNDLKDK